MAARPLNKPTAKFPDTGGIGIGIAFLEGKQFGLAVRLQREAQETHDLASLIREKSSGESDIRFIGRIKAQHTSSRLRPGASIGHSLVTAGSLGAFVEIPTKPGVYILSNNHVLAACDQGTLGDPILHPGVLDATDAMPAKPIGTLANVEKLRSQRASANIMDAAVGRLSDDVPFDPPPPFQGVGAPQGAMVVAKDGRTTRHTTGVVTAIDMDDLWIDYGDETGSLRFDGQIEVEGQGNGPFSLPGDSGSLVWHPGSMEAIGLLFAGSDVGGSNGAGLTYVNPLPPVLSQFRAKLS
ncbi:hypothetical protein ABT237_15605 [Streptomyces sp. NPDC001581]|uniref:hypothetical protein n=1 Tax=Streptomyces sp. NPDC001581 TaxID=3154386 RepID=UPI00332FC6E9